jgi:hypothetical protein
MSKCGNVTENLLRGVTGSSRETQTNKFAGYVRREAKLVLPLAAVWMERGAIKF